MLFDKNIINNDPFRKKIRNYYRIDENICVEEILSQLEITSDLSAKIQEQAHKIVEAVRKEDVNKSNIDAFLTQYKLSSEEGIVLMCMAEALLRIPDNKTIDLLIRDKLGKQDWQSHLGKSKSPFVNASTWGLMLSGKIVKYGSDRDSRLRAVFKKLLNKTSKPIIRKAAISAMSILGKQFVLGKNIDDALKASKNLEDQGYLYSYDMLGEGARTREDAAFYFQSYKNAIEKIGQKIKDKNLVKTPRISIKLTALHPRFEFKKFHLIKDEIFQSVKSLALSARANKIDFTIDAEEAARFEPTLDIFEALAKDKDLQDWQGLGLALQAYQKRALPTIDWLIDLAKKTNRKFNIRLVKGAYWDTEIKLAQEAGLNDYPVFTRKSNTDISYLACALKLLENRNVFYPQFATHNAHTIAAVYNFAGDNIGYEFQRLHGMGQDLYNQISPKDKFDIPCQIYAPVGNHENLLAYLVRRLLENGANNSFVNLMADKNIAIEEIIKDPISQVKNLKNKRHNLINLPKDIFSQWQNSNGPDLSDIEDLNKISKDFQEALKNQFKCASIVNGKIYYTKKSQEIFNKSNQNDKVAEIFFAEKEQCDESFEIAASYQKEWSKTSVIERAKCLEKMADILQENMNYFMAILTLEAGKTLPDCIAEVREAIDFCRYYAFEAKKNFAKPIILPGPTGESNQLSFHGRGVFVCISPWNFPLAIFLGQVAAALVSGNTVIAKPAEQTSIVAFEATKLFHKAGIPAKALHLLLGDGKKIGGLLLDIEKLSGVCFTGSNETAHIINRQLASRDGPIVPFIAETGGQNAMIVDSSALIEQVVDDVIRSSFQSAGQRCSALRVLYIQKDIAQNFITMLKGAMQELKIGNIFKIENDIGPVIDRDSLKILEKHSKKMTKNFDLIAESKINEDDENLSSYLAAQVFEINNIHDLKKEVFGPILHIIRFDSQNLKKVVDEINQTNFGLTLGIHSRIQETIDFITQNAEVGNCYVNRDQIGAVVGCQPFGGENLSGTGPKAGGPQYLFRFITERAICVDTTAQGGNTSLLALD